MKLNIIYSKLFFLALAITSLVFSTSSATAQTQLWGMTEGGGQYGAGTIFKTDSSGNNYSVQHNFVVQNEGFNPKYTNLIQATNGKLYGMTVSGGSNNMGVIFQYDPLTSVITKTFDFTGTATGSYPNGSLMQASDGMLYGMTNRGGANNYGVLFQFDPVTNTYVKKFDFDGLSGGLPYGSLMQASNGKLYGMASVGGTHAMGILFQYDPITSTYIKKHDFNGAADGEYPYGSLIQATDGKLYGMTTNGGFYNSGVLFQYNTATDTVINKWDFYAIAVGPKPYPIGSLIQATDGKLYGMTPGGGSHSSGALFQFNITTNVFTEKFAFDGIANGGNPNGSLTQASDGMIYGMTNGGGTNNMGVLFQYDPTTSGYSKKFEFPGAANGNYPYGSLMQASDGKLYGMTWRGGFNDAGVLFQYDPGPSVYQKKNDFSKMINGGNPCGSLMLSSDGNIYGMAKNGGANNLGVLFQFNPTTATYINKLDFAGVANGSYPFGSLLEASDGKFYGMTYRGGANNQGAFIQYDPVTNNYTKKLDFSSATYGSSPHGTPIQASDGKLYGVIPYGGIHNMGVLFQYDPVTSAYVKKNDFDGSAGQVSNNSLIQASDGILYGMTSASSGTIFQYNPSTSILTKIYDFNSSIDGSGPSGSLIQANDGKLYGMTYTGGANGVGTLFQFDPVTHVFVKKFDFGGIAKGTYPQGSLIQASNGKLYGITTQGGTNNLGVLFQYDPVTNTYVKKMDFNGINGSGYNGDNLCVPITASLIEVGRALNALLPNTCITGNSVNVPIGIAGVYNAGNVFTAQLSDSSGSFAAPVNIGNISSTAAGIINASLPANTLPGTKYRIRVISSNPVFTGNDNGKNISINVLPTVVANANATTVCAGTPVTLTGWGAITYSWTGGVTNAVSFLAAASSTYTVTGTDANNCSNTDAISITVNPLPTVTANASSISVCPQTNVTLTGGGAVTYSWTGGVTNGASFVPPASNAYTVTGTDANNCTNTATVTITVNPLPTVTANASAIAVCSGMPVTLSGGGAATYTWTNGVTNAVAFVPGATNTYTVTGVNANNCSDTASITVTVNQLPTVTANASATIVCAGMPVTLTGSGALTYSWTGGLTNAVSFAPTASDTYTVTGTDGNNCSSIASITIAVTPLPTVTANASATSVCPQTNVTLTGGGANTYSWSNAVNDGITFIPSSTNTYTVTGTDANNCTNTATVTITVNPLPAVTANASATTVCEGTPVTFTGLGATTYSWSGTVSDGVAFVINSLNTYTVTGTDANGCSNTDSITINVNTLPLVKATASDTIICFASSVILTGADAVTYSWSGTVSDGIAFVPNSSANYVVTGTDNNGCSNKDSIRVVVDSTCQVVWPGDANSDGIADNNDILELGLRFGKNGGARSTIDNSWQGFKAPVWASDTVSTGYNLNHADCDGDGTIGLNDTLATNLNYGLTHTFKQIQTAHINSTGDLYFSSTSNVYGANALVNIDIYLGQASAPLQNFYGSAFTLTYNCNSMVPGSLRFNIDNTTWVGNQNTDAIRLTKVNEPGYSAYGAISRTNHANTSGQGKIGTLSFLTTSSVILDTFKITGGNAYAVNMSGVYTPLTAGAYSVLIDGTLSVKYNGLSNNIIMYPNPAINETTIEFSASVKNAVIEIINTLGESVKIVAVSSSQNKISIADLDNGIYYLKITGANNNTSLQKLVVQH